MRKIEDVGTLIARLRDGKESVEFTVAGERDRIAALLFRFRMEGQERDGFRLDFDGFKALSMGPNADDAFGPRFALLRVDDHEAVVVKRH